MAGGKQVMLDMETLSIKTNPAILSIGAVVFDPDAENSIEELRAAPAFYVVVDGAGQADLGLDLDFSTIQWWMQQSDAARMAVFGDVARVPLLDALRSFAAWYAEQAPGAEVWCYGAASDVPWLQSAYEARGLPFPVDYRAVRCLRTLISLSGVERPASEAGVVQHNALDDALFQVVWAQACLRKLAGGRG